MTPTDVKIVYRLVHNIFMQEIDSVREALKNEESAAVKADLEEQERCYWRLLQEISDDVNKILEWETV